MQAHSLPHVVIVGGGFGGLTCARALGDAPVRVTLVDRTNHHLFQPLLYQVATAGLSPADIATPIRSVVRKQENCEVVLGEVTGFDLAAKRLTLSGAPIGTLTYDYLVLAIGARTTWFGHDEWAQHAIGLKDLDEAVEIRRRVLVAFEAAEHEPDPARRESLLTVAIIGGGPTGVEMAGALAELTRIVLARDFRHVAPDSPRVVLIEAGPRLIASFDEKLSAAALDRLRKMGVEVRLGSRVTDIDAAGVHLGAELIPTFTVVWGAGVGGLPLAQHLGAPLDRAGRVVVGNDCALPGHAEVFAIGDMAAFTGPSGHPLPGVSAVAMQQGRSVAANIERDVGGSPREPFEYFDKGSMATIGRSSAVVQAGAFKMSGYFAWVAWLVVHIWYLIGFRNRISVMLNWGWQYIWYRRGARIITGHRVLPGPPPPGQGGATA